MNSEIKFYWALLKKRLPVMTAIFVLCCAIGIGLAFTLPPRYVADARLLVERAQIPEGLAESTVQTSAAEQLQIIEQRLLTRANLIEIADRHDVFAGQDVRTPDEIVKNMRALTSISTSSGRDRATFMTISFKAEQPTVAANVVNEFVTLVRSADAVRRQGMAGQTLDFFEQEVQRLSEELSERSAAIVNFQEENSDALPDGLDFRLDRQARLQERVNILQRDVASLNEQRNRLQAVGASASSSQVRLTPRQQELRGLRSELSSALTVYSEDNPKVRLLRARLASLEAEVEAEGGSDSTADPAKQVLELQLAEIDSKQEFIETEIARSEGELVLLQDAIERTPENAIRLAALEREYDNIQGQYNAAVAALGKAQTGERIEVLAKGERITVIEQAVPPTSPNSPNRQLIAGGGILLGSGLAAAFFVLTELLNRTLRRPIDLQRGIGVQPLATIPYLETANVRRKRRFWVAAVVGLLAAAVLIGLWALHVFYLPLDLIIDKLLNRIGIN